ncbi:hypothetical protein V501_02961 [Pseudogymnoascus sp. VKM F-4519 (FW-2642)]|nr:hypothetical protein V501_02961 [Pseudogymnoascus sp. VKM F-4519 (FW-2642)]
MAPSLESLSVELLDNIVSFIQPRSALFQLALVSKKYNSLATSHLYRHIFLDSDCPDGGIRDMLPFTFIILQKPHIASLVRTFTFRGHFHDEENLTFAPNNEEEDDRRLPWPNHVERNDLLTGLIKRISHSQDEEEEWNEAVLSQHAPVDDAILSLLLISLPNLRLLDLEITTFQLNFLARTFNRVASSQAPFNTDPPFTRLTDIMLTGSDDIYPAEYILLGACCRFPAMKRLYGHRLGSEENRAQLSVLAGAAKIEAIELRNSKLHVDDLLVILRPLKSLRTIIYHIGNINAMVAVRTRDILFAFAIHATSLRRLAIDHEDEHPFYFYPEADSGDRAEPLSFVGFTALTHLRVAPVFLFGRTVLMDYIEPGSLEEDQMLNILRVAFPPNLKSLYVTHSGYMFLGAQDGMERAFEILLRHKECIPSLYELVFEGPFADKESVRRIGQLISLAEEMGVNARAVSLEENSYVKERGWGWNEEASFEMCVNNSMGERVQVLPKTVMAGGGDGGNK